MGRLVWDIAVNPPANLYEVAELNKAVVIARKLGITWSWDWSSSFRGENIVGSACNCIGKAGSCTTKNGGEILGNSRMAKEVTGKFYKLARDKGVFSSVDHEKNIVNGKMTHDQAMFLMTAIVGAALNAGKRVG